LSREERSEYPCPACGAPLYGWVKISSPNGEQPVLDRCENCGLAVAREHAPADVPAELASITRGPGEYAAANRRSLQAAIGEGHWAGLDPSRRLHFTPRAAELLLEKEDLEVGSIRFPLSGRNMTWMWQTLMNAVTLRDNFARDARAGLIHPEGARERMAFSLDTVVTVLAALPVAIIAAPLELISVLLRRGGEMVIEARPVAHVDADERYGVDELNAGSG